MIDVTHPTSVKQLAALAFVLSSLALLFSAAAAHCHAEDASAAIAEQATGEAARRGELQLIGGGSVVGQLQAIDDSENLRWQGDAFREPFEFPLQTIQQLTLETDTTPPLPEDEFVCELPAGDRIFGKLVDLSDGDVVLETSTGQHLSIDRGRIGALARATPRVRELHSGSAGSSKRRSMDDPERISAWRFDPNGVTWAWALGWRLKPLDRQQMNDPFGMPGAARDQPPARLDPRVEQHEQELIRQRGTKSGYFVDLELEPQCALELEIAWDKAPQFDLALGIEHEYASLQQAIRLAIWDGNLVLVRELDTELTLIPVVPSEQLAAEPRLKLTVYLDRLGGRTQVRSGIGQVLAEYVAMENRPQAGRGVRLFAGEGTRIDQLWATAFSWNSLASSVPQTAAPGVVLRGGETISGTIEQFDIATQTLSIKQQNSAQQQTSTDKQDAAREIVLDQVQYLVVTPARKQTDAAADTASAPPTHRATTSDGWSLRGQLLAITADAVRLQVPGIDESVELPLSRLTSLISMDRKVVDRSGDTVRNGAQPADRTQQLTTTGTRLPGKIAASDPDADDLQLRFHPEGSLTAAGLRTGVDGEIAFRPRPQIAAASSTRVIMERQPAAGGLGGGLLQFFGGAQPPRRVVVAEPVAPPGRGPDRIPGSQSTLFLRSGDTLDCAITRIDEQGVTFTTPVIGQGFARHDQVQSVILAGLTQPKQISKATRDRLLMIPRSRRDDPPTHLVCSRSGDFVRGRLLSLDDESLQMEVRLDARRIPRDRVAQIFWLHGDEISGADSEGGAATEVADAADATDATDAEDGNGDATGPAVARAVPAGAAATDDSPAEDPAVLAAQPLRVQAVRTDGTRMTFNYLGCRDETTLVGRNDVLGPCGVEVSQLERLLIGRAIEQSLGESPLALWRLYHAPTPKAFLPQSGSEGAAGTESALVGKPAPEFELQLLGGQRFRLADCRGQVVVLDFWASWCGPCIAAMPQIEAAVSEFAADNVRLVAVNLQEPQETIKAALERMGLDVTVAMDRNGTVAEQYGVTAIPQTVVIGPDGDVARLYIGVNSSFAQELRTAIGELLEPAQAATDP